ncbi:epimerase [Vibrio parahaemolyticus]|uniref:NAD-dependent epimerase/dehydratase family protein n=1 Tax=Vibrio parahaemolyticus TaxID=670 RepID=UPI00111CE5AE|nr:NAD-dependent epimerase/dehydratase family protein [Vibrio parahaemolyticus]EKA7411171.1 NAD-dependent epimerase/dehydratase family protein [Vibrio parahaemolyticus]TOL68443.1 epimerase [Vibrio parahaemolyticus]HCE4577556.1 NAD-dependent epimerase/dehydratase family protein [Vibrio parahaemolyticus]HCG7585349.1 NAD-dependent epimerase/dehydratase family protein [Vibrio parahaemolyticus]
MKVIIFGATGMVGRATLRECLNANDVTEVLAIGRSKLEVEHPKLDSLILDDMFNYEGLTNRLSQFDACLFCLGTSISSSTEEEYLNLNQTLPLTVAKAMSEANPDMSFVYISGKGTDSSETGKVAWARIKGKTENDLLKMPFKAVYLLRPALIIPMNGEESQETTYRLLYRYTGWLMRLVRGAFPSMITDSEKVGTAILNLLRRGESSVVVENQDINLIVK